MRWLAIWFIKAWRAVVSPWYGPVCKYYPSCSAYGLEALEIHGAMKGSVLTLRRLFRCHPWSSGGVDPVPGSVLERRLKEWQLESDDTDQVSQINQARQRELQLAANEVM